MIAGDKKKYAKKRRNLHCIKWPPHEGYHFQKEVLLNLADLMNW